MKPANNHLKLTVINKDLSLNKQEDALEYLQSLFDTIVFQDIERLPMKWV